MTTHLAKIPTQLLSAPEKLPDLVQTAGANAHYAYDEFFAGIESVHTLRAYRHAVGRFLAWGQERHLSLATILPSHVSDYIKALEKANGSRLSKPSRKLHLSALRHFFDKCVQRHAMPLNPALSVRGPRLKIKEGKTPPINPDQARQLLHHIDNTTLVGKRDKAMIATLIYTAARGGAVARLRMGDYYSDSVRWFFHFEEKGDISREIPLRHDLQAIIAAYIEAAQITGQENDAPLFRTAIRRSDQLTQNTMTENDLLRMVKRRLRDAGLPTRKFCCHSFRAGTATDLINQGIRIEEVQELLGHSDPRTTALYDHTTKQVTQNLVERISV